MKIKRNTSVVVSFVGGNLLRVFSLSKSRQQLASIMIRAFDRNEFRNENKFGEGHKLREMRKTFKMNVRHVF